MVFRMKEQIQDLDEEAETLAATVQALSQEMQTLTEDEEHCSLAYVTHEDLSNLPSFMNNTVLTVRAPAGSRMDILGEWGRMQQQECDTQECGVSPVTAL